MSNTTTKSTLRGENDPDLSNLIANQVLKPLEYPQPVVGLERLRKLVHVVQSAVRSLTCPNDLLLAGKMGRMIGKLEQAVEPNQIAMFNSLSLGSAGQHPVWQDSPGNFDG